MNPDLLTLENITVKTGKLTLLDTIAFSVKRGETIGIVGESGSGKSMTAWTLLGLLPHGVNVVGGTALFKGRNLFKASGEEMRALRGKEIAMIFQDPHAALNPIRTIAAQMDDVIRAHFREDKEARRARMRRFLTMVELAESERVLSSYPFQLSGGMLQRVLIAMALCLEPDMLIADEPTTALDALIRLQIVELLQKVQRETGMAMMVISHDFGVVSKLAGHILVMYGGRVAEYAATADLLTQPRHPYSKALLKSRPRIGHIAERLYAIPGTPPAAGELEKGCKFEPRCPFRAGRCRREAPPLYEYSRGRVACFFHEDLKSV